MIATNINYRVIFDELPWDKNNFIYEPEIKELIKHNKESIDLTFCDVDRIIGVVIFVKTDRVLTQHNYYLANPSIGFLDYLCHIPEIRNNIKQYIGKTIPIDIKNYPLLLATILGNENE